MNEICREDVLTGVKDSSARVYASKIVIFIRISAVPVELGAARVEGSHISVDNLG